MMRLRTAIIAVVVFAVLFSALVLYIRSLASSFVPYVTPAAPGPVSLQAHVNTSRMITYNDTHNLAAMKMWDLDCGAIAVVHDEGELVGMITDRDICMAAYTRRTRS